MNDWILAYEPALRFGTFFSVFAVMALWELIASRRELSQPRGERWFANLLNATSIFNHGNVRLPLGIDRWLRWIVVTPDMHRVHHSVEIDESNSNFGFNLPWWDHFFGTYRAQPRAGHLEMRIGVHHLQKAEPSGVIGLIGMPFVAKPGGYPIGHRWSSGTEQAPDPDENRGSHQSDRIGPSAASGV